MGDRWRVRMKLTTLGVTPNRLGIREGLVLPSRLCYFPSEPTSTNPYINESLTKRERHRREAGTMMARGAFAPNYKGAVNGRYSSWPTPH